MNFRSTTLLFGLLLGMLWLFGLTVAHKKTAVDATFLLPSLQADSGVVIDTVTIQRRVPGKKPEEFQFIKDKDNDAWSLKVPGVEKTVKLETFKIDQIVRQVKDARRSDEAGVNDDLAMYNLDQPATTITLKGKAPEKKEHEWQLFLGKESADQAFVYVNSSDRPNKVFGMSKSSIDSVLFKDPNHLRARRLFEFGDSAAQTIDVKESGRQLDLKKGEDTNWRFEKPALGFADFEGLPAPKDAPPGAKSTEGGVKGLLAAIGGLRVDSDDDFVPLSQAPLADYGLEEGKEAMRIAVGTLKEKGDKKDLVKETLAVGNSIKDKNQVYGRMLGDQGVFKLNTKMLEPIKNALNNPGTLRSLDVVNVDTKKVDAVTVDQKGTKLTLYHPEGKSWEVQVGTAKVQRANDQACQGALDALQGKREILKFYDGDDFKKLDEEMKSPVAVVALYVGGLETPKKDEEKKNADKDKEVPAKKENETKKDTPPQLKKDAKAAVTLSFAGVSKDSVNVQRVLADGTTSRFVIPKSLFDRVIPGDISLAFIETNLPELAAADVDRIDIKREKEKLEIQRGWGDKSERWYFKEGNEPPGKNPTDTAKTSQFVNSLLNLSAKKWLHKLDSKEDLAKYGLAKPSLEITFSVHKERPAAAAGLVGLLASPSQWRGLSAEAVALANRFVGPSEMVLLKVGNESTEDKDKPGVYALRSDKDLLFLLPGDVAKKLRDEDLHDRTSILIAQAVVDSTLAGLEALKGPGALVAASPLSTNLVQSFDPARAKELKLAIRSREELRTLTFRREPASKEKVWQDVSGLQEFNLDTEKVTKALDQLAALKANRWVNLGGGAKSEQKLTAKEASLRVEVVLEDGKTITLTVGAPFEAAGYYARTSAWPDAVFLVTRSQIDPFMQGPGYFAKERVAAGP